MNFAHRNSDFSSGFAHVSGCARNAAVGSVRRFLRNLLTHGPIPCPNTLPERLAIGPLPAHTSLKLPNVGIAHNAIDGIRAHGRIGRIAEEIDKCGQLLSACSNSFSGSLAMIRSAGI